MPNFSSSGTCAVAAPNTVLGLTGGTSSRFAIYYFAVGSYATPADLAFLWSIARSTAAGSGGTARTPVAIDAADAAATVACQEAPTTEPTYTANSELFEIGVNMRSTFQMYFTDSGRLIAPATSNNGLGLYVTHASDTTAVYATIHHAE